MTIWSDIRHAARRLAHEPGFAVISVLMLALGIGANTAIFSIVDGVLLRTLPYREPDRLLSLREVIPAIAATYPTLPVSARHFTEWRARCTTFDSLSVISRATTNLTGEGEPERLNALRVSANLFETLGVQPRLGRSFLPGEDTEGRERVAILGDGLWRRRFQADPAIIGKTILLDSQPHTVVGVMPAWFRVRAASLLETGKSQVKEPDLFKPIAFPKYELDEIMGMFNHGVVARLKIGVSREAALSELNVVESQIEKLSGEHVNLKASAIPLQESVVGASRPGLIVLLGAVGAVLLIVCVNLANLMLARAQRRSHEWAVRAAVGATQGRLIRMVLVESLLVAIIGGTLGIGVASVGLGELLRHAPPDIPRLDEVRIDWRVLLFAFGMMTATGFLFGLAPAWHSARVEPQTTLKAGGTRATGGRRESRFRNTLVSAEVGLSTVLLILAALLGNSFLRVLRAEKGFNAPTVLAADIAIPWSKYQKEEQRNRFHEQLLERVTSQPGIASAAICTALPLTGEIWVDAAYVPGDTRPPVQRPMVNVRFISGDYLATMGIPLISGRTFEERDRTRKVAILSERIARELWPGQDPIGRKFARGDDQMFEVIGLARDVRSDPDKAPAAIVYRPYWDWAPRQVLLVARAVADPRSIAGAMRHAVRSVDPDVPIPEMQTMQQILDESIAQRLFQTILASSFAATALLLAGLGIYGVISYTVIRRTPEIGVRIALGAGSMAVRRMVLAQAMLPVAIGLAAGVAVSLGAGRVLEKLLYEVSARDPWAIAGVVIALATVAACACWGPTRRATRVDPLQALRYE
jgi:putative ABC transport system permease protein